MKACFLLNILNFSGFRIAHYAAFLPIPYEIVYDLHDYWKTQLYRLFTESNDDGEIEGAESAR